MVTCTQFRQLLAKVLQEHRSLPQGESLGAQSGLSWHDHLHSCESCRELLAEEEVLEELLASLPAPRLPAALASRVLARLSATRGLDRLLDQDPAPQAPADLAGRVLSGLQNERLEQRLDALLERVPEPTVPEGLSARLLAALETERRPVVHLRLLKGGLRYAAAAALFLTLGYGAWRLVRSDDAGPSNQEKALVVEPATAPRTKEDQAVEEELLASLDVLENWDWLLSNEVDVLLAEFDPTDETLLELGSDGLAGELAPLDEGPVERDETEKGG